jgi:hemoglobin-like flavoprotein
VEDRVRYVESEREAVTVANPLSADFYDSLDRCLLAPGFLTRFYEIFLASSPEVREKFRDTDFSRQTRMLRASLHMTLAAGYGSPEAPAHLERLAILHGKGGRNIGPHLYRLWLDALVQAASEHDPDFTPDLATAWRDMLTPGINILVAAYEAS